MARRWRLDRRRSLGWVAASCGQFVVLTLVAMLVYPGGTVADPATKGYSFFRNFFSDLGRTVTPRSEPNTVSLALFVVALTLAGLGLALFFLTMPSLFRRPRPARVCSLAGSSFGVVAGLSFAGVAFTPANLVLPVHALFVQVAFLSFFVATLGYTAAIVLAQDYPRRHLAIFGAFALLLAGYLWLLFFGPELDSPQGLLIQATGQKIIVYAAVLSVGLQAVGARRVLKTGAGA
ncbi:MAG: hypothetical protein PVF47_20690 [Anaerolineae bacterium]|jgi:hypothetical membrane protein